MAKCLEDQMYHTRRNFPKLSREKPLLPSIMLVDGWMIDVFFHPMSSISVFLMYFVQLLFSNIWKWRNLSWFSFGTWRHALKFGTYKPWISRLDSCPPWQPCDPRSDNIFPNRAKHLFLFYYRMLPVQNANSIVMFLIILSLVPLAICKKTCM